MSVICRFLGYWQFNFLSYTNIQSEVYIMMQKLDELTLSYKHILDGCVILYGTTGSGKSFIICDMLFQLRPFIEQIIVISPTDKQNRTYESGIVPLPCIHYTVTKDLLVNIWDRQSALSSVHTRSNSLRVLRSLFNKIKNNESVHASIVNLNIAVANFKREITRGELSESIIKTKIENEEKRYEKMLALIFKKNIIEHRCELAGLAGLSPDEKFSLKY